MASEEAFKHAYTSLVSDIASTICMENALSGRGPLKVPKPRGRSRRCKGHPGETPTPRDPIAITRAVLDECVQQRKRARPCAPDNLTDEALSKMARFTDKFNLQAYQKFLHYVPRIVNVVTRQRRSCRTPSLTRATNSCSVHISKPRTGCQSRCTAVAEAIPVEGSGLSLPLDLHHIATRCRNSYYAPKKFSAVQLAYNEPRCRVLVFHTGRMVGTGTCQRPCSARPVPAGCPSVRSEAGCSGPIAARLALMRAQRQLYHDAGVHVHVRNFAVRTSRTWRLPPSAPTSVPPASAGSPQVINQVGAVSLRATLNCEEFATAHSSTAHFDAKSFVGLAWRPVGEPICCGACFGGHLHQLWLVTLPCARARRDLLHGASQPAGFNRRTPSAPSILQHASRALALFFSVAPPVPHPGGRAEDTPHGRERRHLRQDQRERCSADVPVGWMGGRLGRRPARRSLWV